MTEQFVVVFQCPDYPTVYGPFPGQVEAETWLFHELDGTDGTDLAYGDEVNQPTLAYLQESYGDQEGCGVGGYSVHVVPLSTTNERRP